MIDNKQWFLHLYLIEISKTSDIMRKKHDKTRERSDGMKYLKYFAIMVGLCSIITGIFIQLNLLEIANKGLSSILFGVCITIVGLCRFKKKE